MEVLGEDIASSIRSDMIIKSKQGRGEARTRNCWIYEASA